MKAAFAKINKVDWKSLSQHEFAKKVAKFFSAIWQAHPFKEGNTRTVVMFMTFFIENFGYYFDQQLIAASAGYMRNAFVLASLGEYSEYEHLEKILTDAICTEPIDYSDDTENEVSKSSKYEKYYTKDYKPKPHEYSES